MKPSERYALKVLEEKYRPDLEEQRREAEALIEAKRQEYLKMNAVESESDEGPEATYVVQKVVKSQLVKPKTTPKASKRKSVVPVITPPVRTRSSVRIKDAAPS